MLRFPFLVSIVQDSSQFQGGDSKVGESSLVLHVTPGLPQKCLNSSRANFVSKVLIDMGRKVVWTLLTSFPNNKSLTRHPLVTLC